MRRLPALLCALALLAACPVRAEGAQPLPEGRSRYVMDVTLDTDSGRLTESVTVAFENDSDAVWTQVCFNDYVPAVQEHARPGAYTAAVTAVTDGAGAPLPFVHDRQEGLLTVTLPQPLQPGGAARLTVGYEADVPRAEGERFQAASFPDSQGITFRLCQFYPILCVWRDGAFVHHPYAFGGEAFFSACADYTLTLRLPEAFTVIASGDETLLGAENGQAVWQIDAVNMRDLVITATTEFAAPYTAQADGVTVNSWGTPAQAAQAESSLQTALDCLRLFGELFGAYPYGELDICVAYMPEAAGGIEYPGLIEIMRADMADPASLGVTVAHEVAHQWFYGVVGNDQYDEPFLDESFASFCEYLYRERVLGESRQALAADIDTVGMYMDAFLSQPGFRLDLSYGDYQAADGDGSGLHYYLAIYEFGDMFFWRVRQAMGDEAFYAMLRTWYQDNMFQTPTLDQFLAHLTQASGGDPAVAAVVDELMTR